ncbi:epimerase [Alkalilimnicola ehrlichii]|uniref:Epimerase n=1 Tax=Alkalilimnicola ehrlichii TaxID=351052 RepID=A0A3E0WLH1_9GAMM|nr:NAD-dependent epimerase/dehydratase family protein [Alkalilimnicola ehrlichii]RFA26273.1 epimerase [Alkalilimnicola ehrlichii]RFA33259.1 epimerase [Alkalilimnicola ehrlichii]
MQVFVTGATGYIGGSVARLLLERGATVRGLARTDTAAQALERLGVAPVRGSLAHWSLLAKEARAADAVINAADADDAFAASALLTALEGTGKRFIHTSGSSVVGDMASGVHSSPVFSEDSHIAPRFEKAGRVAIDRAVAGAASRGVHSVVLCPTMIYGLGTGAKVDSIQIPWLIELARESGHGRHIGEGKNIWSHVHIGDLAELYLLALDAAPAGSFFFAEQGESSLKDIAAAISRMLGFGGATAELAVDEAALRWGPEAAHFAFGSNSRVTAEKARRMLNWSPSQPGLIEEIENGCYSDMT